MEVKKTWRNRRCEKDWNTIKTCTGNVYFGCFFFFSLSNSNFSILVQVNTKTNNMPQLWTSQWQKQQNLMDIDNKRSIYQQLESVLHKIVNFYQKARKYMVNPRSSIMFICSWTTWSLKSNFWNSNVINFWNSNY